MGRNLYIRCACGVDLADQISRRFEQAFLKDGLRLRAWLLDLREPPVPWAPLDDDREHVVAAADFVAWHQSAREVLESNRDLLPTLHQIWLRSPHGGAKSSWAYLEWEGRGFVAEADDAEEIVLLEKPRAVFDALVARDREAGVRSVPVLDAHAASALTRGGDGAITMPAPLFEQLFEGTGFELERADVLDYFARDFEELRKTALHARDCGQALRMRFV